MVQLLSKHDETKWSVGVSATFRIPTVDEIHAWVAAQPPDEIVGTAESPNSCLVARAAEHLNPNMAFEVIWAEGDQGTIELLNMGGDPCHTWILPDDLNHLAERFDTLGPLYSASCDLRSCTMCDLTAAEVLEAWPRLVRP